MVGMTTNTHKQAIAIGNKVSDPTCNKMSNYTNKINNEEGFILAGYQHQHATHYQNNRKYKHQNRFPINIPMIKGAARRPKEMNHPHNSKTYILAQVENKEPLFPFKIKELIQN